ncbi:hypothetical protein PRZ48_007407 [Zasmidium cellare]|uniref:GED domain-containing protein n=1 Tax=Zasmidium cellare TaxID=395010 RepID=A0ABR0EKD3_ZASCE|nr:hypothetical protein PRZ48_007407 [Zasmidium cellare]
MNSGDERSEDGSSSTDCEPDDVVPADPVLKEPETEIGKELQKMMQGNKDLISSILGNNKMIGVDRTEDWARPKLIIGDTPETLKPMFTHLALGSSNAGGTFVGDPPQIPGIWPVVLRVAEDGEMEWYADTHKVAIEWDKTGELPRQDTFYDKRLQLSYWNQEVTTRAGVSMQAYKDVGLDITTAFKCYRRWLLRVWAHKFPDASPGKASKAERSQSPSRGDASVQSKRSMLDAGDTPKDLTAEEDHGKRTDLEADSNADVEASARLDSAMSRGESQPLAEVDDGIWLAATSAYASDIDALQNKIDEMQFDVYRHATPKELTYESLAASARSAWSLHDLLQEIKRQLGSILNRLLNQHTAIMDTLRELCDADFVELPPAMQNDRLEHIIQEIGPTKDNHAMVRVLRRVTIRFYVDLLDLITQTSRTVGVARHEISEILERVTPYLNFYPRDGSALNDVLEQQKGIWAHESRMLQILKSLMENGATSVLTIFNNFQQEGMVVRSLNIAMCRAEGVVEDKEALGALNAVAYREEVAKKLFNTALDDRNPLMSVAGGHFLRAFQTAAAVMLYIPTKHLYAVREDMEKLRRVTRSTLADHFGIAVKEKTLPPERPFRDNLMAATADADNTTDHARRVGDGF